MDLWSAVLEKINQLLSKPSYETWFLNGVINAEIKDGVIIVKAKNEFVQQWLETRYKSLIFQTASEVTGNNYEIEFSYPERASRKCEISREEESPEFECHGSDISEHIKIDNSFEAIEERINKLEKILLVNKDCVAKNKRKSAEIVPLKEPGQETDFRFKSISLEEYGASNESLRYEVIDEKIYLMSNPSPLHQSILVELLTEINVNLRSYNSTFTVFGAPICICFPSEQNGEIKSWVHPDLVVVSDKKKVQEMAIVGVPDLVIEILSDITAKKDKAIKFRYYEKMKIPQYLIVDPSNQFIERYIIENERYQHRGTFFEDDILPLMDGVSMNLKYVFNSDSSKNYRITNELEKATHWIPYGDSNNDSASVTVGKPYELILDDEKELSIIDNKGNFSQIYMVHNGDFVYFDEYGEELTEEEKELIERGREEYRRGEYYTLEDALNEENDDKTSDEMLKEILSENKFFRNQIFDLRGSVENAMNNMENVMSNMEIKLSTLESHLYIKMEANKSEVLNVISSMLK
jgi:Uma2 family endonuclease